MFKIEFFIFIFMPFKNKKIKIQNLIIEENFLYYLLAQVKFIYISLV